MPGGQVSVLAVAQLGELTKATTTNSNATLSPFILLLLLLLLFGLRMLVRKKQGRVQVQAACELERLVQV